MKRTLSVFITLVLGGSASAQFSAPQEITHNDHATTTAADFDQDGDLDLIGWDENFWWYRNDGTASFEKLALTNTWDIPLGADVLVHDMNNDGFPDIIVTPGSAVPWGIRLFVSTGSGALESPIIIDGTSPNAYWYRITDIDNNGYQDLVMKAGVIDELVMYLNQGNLVFTEEIRSFDQTVLQVGDLDGDGIDDVLTGQSNDYKSCINDGAANFNSVIPYTITGSFYFSFLSDYDLDGDNDLIGTSGTTNLRIIKNQGNGLCNTGATFPKPNVNVAGLKDLDQDGYPEVLLQYNSPVYHGYMPNNADGTLGTAVSFGFTASPALQSVNHTFSTIEDLDNDGMVDILLTGSVLFRATGPLTYAVGERPFGMMIDSWFALMDADVDGTKDLVYMKNGAFTYSQGQPDGTFSATETFLAIDGNSFETPPSLQVCDINNDGMDDLFYCIALTGNNASFRFMTNNGDGTMTPGIALASVSFIGKAIVTRFDADAYPDVVYYNNGTVKWVRNLGNGTFSAPVNLFSDFDMNGDLECADFDDDGDTDVFLSRHYLPGFDLFYLPNNGDGTVGAPVILVAEASGSSLIAFLFEDINLDGNLDFVYDHADNMVDHWRIYTGDGAGSYTFLTETQTGLATRLVAGDVNHDGLKDLVDMTGDGALSIHFQDEDGMFTGPWFPQELLNIQFSHIMLNGGNQDIFFLSFNADGLFLIENRFSHHVKGKLFADLDGNNQDDPTDLPIPFKAAQLMPSGYQYFSNAAGNLMASDIIPGPNQLVPPVIPNFNLVTTPAVYDFTPDPGQDSIFRCEFGYAPGPETDDIQALLTGAFHRCNTVIHYWIDLTNRGTTNPEGIIQLTLDPQVTFVSAGIGPDSISGQIVYWHFDSLAWFGTTGIDVLVQMPDFNSIGDLLTSSLDVFATGQNGEVTSTWTDSLQQVLSCAYDPNDKTVMPAGIGPEGYIPTGQEWMDYTVRFQNTGNDTAISVVILDQLDNDLDWTTLLPLGSSHPMEVSVSPQGQAAFAFPFIHLPDSNTNELASHGFVRYRIRLKENLPAGTKIHNTANIYFDYNPAVVTNTTLNTLFTCAPLSAVVTTETCMTAVVEGAVDTAPGDNVTWQIDGITSQTGETFSWVSDTAGTYQLHLSIVNDLCSTDTLISVTVSPLPQVSLASWSADTLCEQEGPVALPVAVPSGGTYSGPGVSASQFDPETAGPGTHSLIYTFTDQNNCSAADSVIITVIDCLGINEATNGAISVFPNPSNGKVSIFFTQPPAGYYDITVTNTMGQTILSNSGMTGNTQVIDLAVAGKGIYLLKVTQNTGAAEIVRVIVE